MKKHINPSSFFLLPYSLFLLVSLVACSPSANRVFGRYVPERKDDFAWENEYAAYRCYGPALANENPSNGVDLWFKASPELIIDSFYHRDLDLKLPYHLNYGKGMDGYKVGHTAGSGGLVVEANGQLWVGGPYSRYEVLNQTPELIQFCLSYDSLWVAGIAMQEQITITCQAGQRLNRADVVITAPEGTEVPELMVGGGIYLHDSIDHPYLCTQCGAIAYAEAALSDKGAVALNDEFNGGADQGRAYIAVITPNATVVDIKEGCLVSLKPYALGDTLTYYFGGAWSQWSDGKQSIPTDDDWWQTIKQIATTND